MPSSLFKSPPVSSSITSLLLFLSVSSSLNSLLQSLPVFSCIFQSPAVRSSLLQSPTVSSSLLQSLPVSYCFFQSPTVFTISSTLLQYPSVSFSLIQSLQYGWHMVKAGPLVPIWSCSCSFGEIVNFHVMSKHCDKCKTYKAKHTEQEFEEWWEKHKYSDECEINYEILLGRWRKLPL